MKQKTKEQKQQEFKEKMQKKSLENKAILAKRSNKVRAAKAKELANKKELYNKIDAAKAEGVNIGFQPSPIVKLSPKTKNLKEPISGFNPFSKAAQLGKKK